MARVVLTFFLEESSFFVGFEACIEVTGALPFGADRFEPVIISSLLALGVWSALSPPENQWREKRLLSVFF